MFWTGSKYGNVKTEIDGIRFDSKREARRWQQLKLLEKSGRITKLERQVPFDVVVVGKKICRYKADFVYLEGGKQVVEDAKGYRTEVYRLKKKLVEALHDIKIVEV